MLRQRSGCALDVSRDPLALFLMKNKYSRYTMEIKRSQNVFFETGEIVKKLGMTSIR